MGFSAWGMVLLFIYTFYSLFLFTASFASLLGSEAMQPWVYFGVFVAAVPPVFLLGIFCLLRKDNRDSTRYPRAKWDLFSWKISSVVVWLVTGVAGVYYLAKHGNVWLLNDILFKAAHTTVLFLYGAMVWMTFGAVFTYGYRAYELFPTL
jgi:hypothetical protein